jgi:hypothetical protein
MSAAAAAAAMQPTVQKLTVMGANLHHQSSSSSLNYIKQSLSRRQLMTLALMTGVLLLRQLG